MLVLNILYRTTNRGDSWQKISPDLTTNDPEKQKQEESGGLTIDNSTAENHCTIYTISESPKNSKIIWAGTDDGNLQVTDDDGESWARCHSKYFRTSEKYLVCKSSGKQSQ